MRYFRKNLCLLLAAVLCAPVSPCAGESREETHLVILAVSDMHGNILGYSYEKQTETGNDGMARLYSYIRQVRKENPIVFLIDGGDEIQGTIMTDDIAARQPEHAHPVLAAMNFMGFDTMTLGNHEFDWGIGVMKTILRQAAFPILAANILDADGLPVTGKGWTILERGGVRLAVIGVCTPDIPIWEKGKEGIDTLTYEPANTAVRKAVEEIGNQADLILVSAHMGQYAEFDEENGSDAGEKIIADNPEVDILQVAHMHITVNDRINGVPVVGVRNAGREIARIDVTLGPDRSIRNISTSIVDMAEFEPDKEIRSIPVVQELHEQTLQYMLGSAGDDSEPGEVLGATTAVFQPENEIRGLPEGKLRDTPLPDLILKIQLLNSGADVTSCSLSNIAANLPEGKIYYRNILDIYEYPNTLVTLEVTGSELKAYMEWSAECYNQWVPGDISVSFDPEYPDYLYDMFAGVDYEINLSMPKGRRIENLRFRGEPLREDQVLTLAVSNYRYASGLKAMNLVKGRRNWESSNSVRDMIVAYFADHSPVAPAMDNNWRITGTDLSEGDPRRAEIIRLINEGWMPSPVHRSYNLADYEALIAEAEKNRAADSAARE